MKSNNKIVIISWGHIEGYPPSLNAVSQLAKRYDEVIIYHGNFRVNNWSYPENVNLLNIGAYTTYDEFYLKSRFYKVLRYLKFYFLLVYTFVKTRPNWVLIYDPVGLFYVAKSRWCLNSSVKFWYHNHDVIEPLDKARKTRFKDMLVSNEANSFKWLSLFTLPSRERLDYFNLENFKGEVRVIPNYPSFDFYEKFPVTSKKLGDEIKLIFQGSIGEGHGFEELIPLLGFEVLSKRSLSLTLIGYIYEDYRNYLMNLAEKSGKSAWFNVLPAVPYSKLPSVTRLYDIGIGIHNTSDILYQTGGTASNKLYEYAALGLPILYSDTNHYNEYLEKYDWAVKTDLSKESIIGSLKYIINSYEELSLAAGNDFKEELNFEKHFIW